MANGKITNNARMVNGHTAKSSKSKKLLVTELTHKSKKNGGRVTMPQAPNSNTLTIVFASLLLMFTCIVQTATALPPEVEADKLVLSAAEKMNNKDYSGAGQDLDRIKALGVTLPVDYYYYNGGYMAVMKNTVEAKKNLEIYLEKAGKEGKLYQHALKIYSYVEATEKRLSRFKSIGDGTVTDNQTGLMWPDRDNGTRVIWSDAKESCTRIILGGHKDWRLPTKNELEGLYDQEEAGQFKLTPLIKLSDCQWAADIDTERGKPIYDSSVGCFDFTSGKMQWGDKSTHYKHNFLPVRGGK